jgi:hypothetical protein
VSQLRVPRDRQSKVSSGRRTPFPKDWQTRNFAHYIPRIFRLGAQIVQQCLSVFEVGGIETFGEPAVDLGQH